MGFSTGRTAAVLLCVCVLVLLCGCVFALLCVPRPLNRKAQPWCEGDASFSANAACYDPSRVRFLERSHLVSYFTAVLIRSAAVRL